MGEDIIAMKTTPIKFLLGLFLVLFGTSALVSQVVWYPIDVPTTRQLLSIDFPSEDVGYIGGDGVLLKTLDGGISWQHVEILESDFNLDTENSFVTDLHFFDEQRGLMVIGEWAGLFRTIDGGATWTQEIPANDGFCRFKCLLFEDEDHGLLGGGGCFQSGLVDSYDTGTWSTTETPETFDSSELINGIAHKENVFIAVTNRSRIIRSDDNGANWTLIPIPIEAANITDIALMEDDVFRASYALEGSFGIMKSNDLGLTWDIDWDLATFFYPDMFTLHRNAAGISFVGGIEGNTATQGLIFSQTPDFWSLDVVGQPIRDIDSYGDSVTWAVGDSGVVYVNVNPILLSLPETERISEVSLFPNPCGDFLVLESKYASALADVKVIKADGAICPAELSRQEGKWRIDSSKLAAGNYFVSVLIKEREELIPFIKE